MQKKSRNNIKLEKQLESEIKKGDKGDKVIK